MTKGSKKQGERWTLDAVIASAGLVLDGEPEAGESADFVLLLPGHRVGVEITTYQSGVTMSDGTGRRAVEAEWELLQRTSREFQAAAPIFGT